MQEKSNVKSRVVVLIVIWVILLVLALVFLMILVSLFASQEQSISSLSWAGYIIAKHPSSGFAVDALNASWVVPKINVSATDTYSSAWIGIGGQLDKTLIQVGTEHDSVNGQDTYLAWYELLPNFAVRLTNITVSPGDKITASITLFDLNSNQWTIKLTDDTTGQGFSHIVVYNSTRSSAEWIVERPNLNNQITSLANFSNITFTGCHVTTEQAVGAIDRFNYSKIQMANELDKNLASVSNLSDNGASFTVTYSASK